MGMAHHWLGLSAAAAGSSLFGPQQRAAASARLPECSEGSAQAGNERWEWATAVTVMTTGSPATTGQQFTVCRRGLDGLGQSRGRGRK